MSELREAISTAAWEHVTFTRLPDVPDVMDKSEVIMNINGTWIRINVPVNAILDAVIASLPAEEINNEWRSDYPDEDSSAWDSSQGYTEGHNVAVSRIKAILSAAKEGK